MSVTPHTSTAPRRVTSRASITAWSLRVVALGIALSSAYGLLAAHPYRDIPEATRIAAQAQDVCSVVVAVLLLVLARSVSPRVHVIRLGLLAYVAYSYAIYLIGIPMNRIFVLYVVIVSLSGAVLLDGLVRLRPSGWPRTVHHRLERGTGWMMLVIAVLFGGLWLATLLPYAFGGHAPSTRGPGGVAYPVFVLDLVIVLPCIAAVGVLLLRGRAIAGPLVVVALVKIITLFTALWAGVLVGLMSDTDVHLAADAGPSLVMLAVCIAIVGRWLGSLAPHPADFVRPTFWEQ